MMTVKPRFQILFQVLVVILAALISYGALRYAALSPHDGNKENAIASRPLPDVWFYNAAGQKMALADFRGQIVLVNLWATWCPPCVVELPSLDTLQAKLHDKPFKVVAIAMDRSGPLTVQGFLTSRGIEALDTYWDKDRQIPLKWKYSGLPSSFLLDRDGNVVQEFDGPREWHQGKTYDLILSLLK